MFARVSVYEIPEGRVNDAEKSFADALDQIAALRGFAEGYFLVSHESNRGMAVTLWDDHDAVTASRVTATRVRAAAIDSVGGEVVSADEFEIAVRARPPEPS